MEILYFGKVCDNELYEEMLKKKLPYFVAQYNYEKALTEELGEKFNIVVKSIFQTEYFPKDKILVNKNKEHYKYHYLIYINLPFLREITFFLNTFISLVKWNFFNKGKEKLIYSSNHYPPVSLAIVLFGNIFRVNKVITFTDLSLFTYSPERIKKMKFYKRMVMKSYVRMVDKLQGSYDGYVLFSEQMNGIVNNKKNPYIVCEGIYNSKGLNLQEKNKKNAICHAGTLNKEVGIDKIIEVFELIEDPDLELWLIGKGDMVPKIIEKAKSNTNIKYFGFMNREDVFEKLKESKMLINLRNPNDIYTEYSFPSKMFEYMASGTPVVTTKIKGIPSEYYNFVYSIDSFDSSEIKDIIKKLLLKSDAELFLKGNQAQKFIIDNKNKVNQVLKISNFLKENFK